ncbi:putative lipid II flippase FtsW [Patescibacteria group bacterium]|nr:putative lipid II flippase FtsW [Patescibacteria group bacterium]MBU1755094.1 putative lipid II flippase FtsW [Patescibacteria group bacterium]
MKLSGDRLFSIIVAALVIGGLAIFASASLGLLARTDGAPWRLAFTQLGLGLLPGLILLTILRFIKPQLMTRGVIPFYLFSILATALVFVPGVGATINGATRWIDLGFTTIQPGEFLKIGVVLMFSAYLANIHKQIADPTKGLLGFGLIVGIPVAILLLQPNTSTALIISGTCVLLYFLAGAPWRDFAILGVTALVGLAILVSMRPYLMNRVMTFVNPADNPLTSGYQIQQSLIAIGSGGVTGRGFGQSVQKFNYLPEPVGDSVFAVYGEEFGFAGTIFLVLLFAAFAARGLMIASEAPNIFGMLAATGLTLLISLSAFMNIGAMLGIMPLTGLPLPFVSHGGTALLCALASVGVILNIAAHRTKKRVKE